MDLKSYYRKIRELEASIEEPHPVVVSLETPDGGRAGVMTEVFKFLAAKMVVEGRAQLASTEETAQFRAEIKEAKRAADEQTAASKVQVAIVSEADLRSLRGGGKPSK
jgi:hypothetical protein